LYKDSLEVVLPRRRDSLEADFFFFRDIHLGDFRKFLDALFFLYPRPEVVDVGIIRVVQDWLYPGH